MEESIVTVSIILGFKNSARPLPLPPIFTAASGTFLTFATKFRGSFNFVDAFLPEPRYNPEVRRHSTNS